MVDSSSTIRRIELNTLDVSTVYKSDGYVEAITSTPSGVLYFTEILNG